MYNKHFLLKIEDIEKYIENKINFFEKDEDVEVKEIGDGNINYVFKASGKKSGKSIILKQADVLLRSSGRPLDINRNKIECNILKIQSELAKQYVPEVYFYDEKMSVIGMEDISEYKNMRIELMNEKIFPKFVNDINTFMVNTLLYTTDLVLDKKIKKERVKEFINPDLCDISEDLVFTEPYINYKDRNIVLPEMKEFVQNNFYNDDDLIFEVGKLKNIFMNFHQSLIHGDLHSGSIFINAKGIKIIDPEFAFYGPIGYDVGNVLAHMILSYIYSLIKDGKKNSDFINWNKNVVDELLVDFKSKFEVAYKENVKDVMFSRCSYRKWYIEEIISNALATAGLEMVRRTIGDTKVAEITSFNSLEKRLLLEKTVLLTGKDLIMNKCNRDNLKLSKLINDILKSQEN